MAYAFDYAARSEVGLVRASNQDSAYASPNLLVVADGMGGHAGGDVASTIAIEIIKHLDHPGHTPATALEDLENALDHSQLALIRASDAAPQLQGLGTTVVCLLRTETTLVMAHMGDSRAYLLRGGQLTQVTVDHTFVQHLVDIGRITPEEAEVHPQRNVVMRVLSDFDLDLHPDVSVREAKIGDRWLLCSDGLSGFVSPQELADILATVPDPDQAADLLISKALQNRSTDNVTCLVADIVDPETHFGPRKSQPTASDTKPGDATEVIIPVSAADPASTMDLGRPLPRIQIVGAAADGGPLPDLVAAVVAGDDWDDDLHDDAEPMSDLDLAEHGLTRAQQAHRARVEDIPTNPVPVVTPAGGIASIAAVLAHNEMLEAQAHEQAALVEAPVTELPTRPARVDPLYLNEDDDPRAKARPRRRPWRTVAVVLAIVAALAIGLWQGYAWTQRQYFVGVYQNQVAVFRGISQDIGPISLHRPVLIYDVDTQTFPTLFQARLADTIRANSYEDGVERAERLIIDARSQSPAALTRPNSPGRTVVPTPNSGG